MSRRKNNLKRIKKEKRRRQELRVVNSVSSLLDVIERFPGEKILSLRDHHGNSGAIVAYPDGFMGGDPVSDAHFRNSLGLAIRNGGLLVIRVFDADHPSPLNMVVDQEGTVLRQKLYGASLGGRTWRPLSSHELHDISTKCPCCDDRIPEHPGWEYFDLRPIVEGLMQIEAAGA